MVSFEGVVAVQNYGSSGSTLMQSLLDMHPRLLSLPGLHAHALYVFWEEHGHRPAAELLPLFLDAHGYWFEPSLAADVLGLQQMGPCRDEPTRIERAAFAAALQAEGWSASAPLVRQAYITSIYIAYARALGRNLDAPSYWVVFPIHSHPVGRAQYLVEDFAKVYFLHTIRNPVQNMGSLVKHVVQNADFKEIYLLEAAVRQVLQEDAIHALQTDVRGFHPYFPDSADGRVQSRAVRLEDMHEDSEATMRSVAGWLSIAWDPVLLKSTYDGRLWNNRRESVRISGLGEAVIRQKHAEIFNLFDRWRIKQVVRPVLLFYRYAPESAFAPLWQRRCLLPLLLWVPFKAEWAYPHARRVFPAAYLRVERRYNAIGRWWVKRLARYALMPLAWALSARWMLQGFWRARHYLLEGWRHSFTVPSDTVPLLRLRMRSNNLDVQL